MKRIFTFFLLTILLVPVCTLAQNDGGSSSALTVERKYKVHFANEYSLPGWTIILDNTKKVEVIYMNYVYHDAHKGKGLHVAVGESNDNWMSHEQWSKATIWNLGNVLKDQWVSEKVEIDVDGTLRYYQNGTLMRTGNFPELKLENVKSFRLAFGPGGWWTGHYHYMSNLKITAGENVITDDFSKFNNDLWQRPKNPDGVRVEGGIMKMDQKRTDQDFALLSKNITLEGLADGGFGDNNIVMEYRDSKLLNDDPDYKLYEDNVNIHINGRCYCENTHKMYFLDGINTVIEYDITNAMNKQVARRSFQLPFAVEMYGNVMEVSPNGMYLAFVDEDGTALHIVNTATGSEVASAPLGEKYKNIIKKKGKNVSGHPFNFLSNNEVLVSGTANALLYDISKKKGKKLSFPKLYNLMPKYTVKPGGQISGIYSDYSLQFATFTVANGKITSTIPSVFYEGDCVGLYRVYKNNSWKDWSLYDEATNVRVDNQLEYSDRSEFVFKQSNVRKRMELQPMNNNQLHLYFPKMQWFEYIDNHKLLLIWTEDKKVQIFNHTLTKNEMEKQYLLTIMDKNSVSAFDNYISQYANSRYADIARQKRTECIRNNWQKLSSPTDYSVTHAKAVQSYIDKYGSDVNVDAARAELDNIYKQALNNIGRSDIDGFNKYLTDFPQSPYLTQAQKKLKEAYRYSYNELCQNTDPQAYVDYLKKYPDTPYSEEIKERGRVMYDRQQAEKQRLKEEEEQRKMEEMLQRNAAKLNCVGRTIHWTEEVTYDISSSGDGLLVGLLKSAAGLDKVKYEVRYSAVVESNIGETAVKCIITSVRIQDPSWASVNYLKYKKYALSELQENVGKTRVLQLDDFEL